MKFLIEDLLSLEFIIDIFLPVALWPLGQLSLWQKWVPGMLSWNLGASTSWNPQGLSRPV